MLYSLNPWLIFNFYAQQAPEYSERAVELAEEIKRLFFSDIIGADDDLVKRLQIVDTLESLGIDRHFQHEIQIALDYVYRLAIYIYNVLWEILPAFMINVSYV